MREGTLDDLTGVTNLTEYVIENAPDGLEEEIATLLALRGGKMVSASHPRRNLESVFLEATQGDVNN